MKTYPISSFGFAKIFFWMIFDAHFFARSKKDDPSFPDDTKVFSPTSRTINVAS